MGRRSRLRGGVPMTSAAPPPGRPVTPSRKSRRDEAPAAPWGGFPLIELAVLTGLALIVAGFVADGQARAGLITAGILTASFAGLELSVREHFAGYRSHSSLLAGVVAFIVGLPLWIVLGVRYLALACALVAAATAFWLLRAAFARRAGGLSFRA